MLDFSPDAAHEDSGFSETLPEKGLEFVLSRRDNTVAFNLSLVLLPVEVNDIPEEQGHEGGALEARGTGHLEIVFALSTKVVALYLGAILV